LALSNHKPLTQSYEIEEFAENIHHPTVSQRKQSRSMESECRSNNFNFSRHQRKENKKNRVYDKVFDKVEANSSRSFDMEGEHSRGNHHMSNHRERYLVERVPNNFDSYPITRKSHQHKYSYRYLHNENQEKEECKTRVYQNPDAANEFHRLHERKGSKLFNSCSYSESDWLSKIQVLKDQIEILEREQIGLENRKGCHDCPRISSIPKRKENRLCNRKNSHHYEIPCKLRGRYEEDEFYHERASGRTSNEGVHNRHENYVAQPALLEKSSTTRRYNEMCMSGVQDLDKISENEVRDKDSCHFFPVDHGRDDFQVGSYPIGTRIHAQNMNTRMHSKYEYDSHDLHKKITGSRETQNRPVSRSDNYYVHERDGGIEEGSYQMETLNCDIASKGIVGREIEERVARKLKSRDRRAQIGLLCSEYVVEREFWDTPLFEVLLRCVRSRETARAGPTEFYIQY